MDRHLLSKLALTASFTLLTACAPKTEHAARPAAKVESPRVIPVPKDFKPGSGVFRVDAATPLIYSGAGAAEAAQYFDRLAQQDPQLTVRRPREETRLF